MTAEWTEEDRSRFRCIDCGVDTSSVSGIGEYYAVHDHVWPLARDAGMLCIGCLETRLGRELTVDDFDLEAPINHPEWWPNGRYSRRFRERLGLPVGNINLRYQ